ncbi:hypothetical protein Pse7367_0498 [Thalassoporum mexicanum PCC 7367]|uniref:malectin domain-containing carbohydrate-binding protein n=1 Tax=Thalassoporum mexicanum TaxID=3457544 RepID=UPI00029FBD28|nr:malectin domain-containing carbohydrate-binding protein [Pseudanabaena sp. PCC 7367]AFY68806.1 hypothetical protein Pse7367_0498 [Pseudanabaena sp. PCC 7367]
MSFLETNSELIAAFPGINSSTTALSQGFTQGAGLNSGELGGVVFVDERAASAGNFAAGALPGLEVVFLDADRDGVAQIGEYLSGFGGFGQGFGQVSAIHIISHAASGGMQLGASWLGQETIDSYSEAIAGWQNSLTADADILLYGCNVAKGEAGLGFVQSLSQLSGADVAASDDLTGSSLLGGDWDLEVTTGAIESPTAFSTAFTEEFNDILPTIAQAELVIEPPDNNIVTSSTYSSGSFQISNNSDSGIQIERVVIDISTAILPDLIFDPFGTAGDPIGKDFTPDSGESATGQDSHTFLAPHDGNSTFGYDALEIVFTDFDPGETFTFSIDNDPTSTQGLPAPGPNHAASVSGLELAGTTVTIDFSDGNSYTAATYRIPNSEVGSQAIVKEQLPTAPTIEVLGGITTPDTSEIANQVIRVSAPVGADVSLLQFETALFTDNGSGFDLDPFEANAIVSVDEQSATVGSTGFVDIPVTLTNTDPEAGLNYFTAVVTDSDGSTSLLADTEILQLLGANNAPTTSGIIDVSVVEGEVDSVIDLFSVFDDIEDADADLIYSIESNSEPTLFDDVAINPTTGELTLTYAATAVVGTSDLTIRATDTDGLFVETSFNVAVTEDNSGGGGNPATLLINAGGSAYTDSLNQQWVADEHFTNGKTFGTSQGISGTTDDPLYQTERYNANLAYEIPVADGEYQVTLEFAELYHNSAGNRVFDVLAEGQLFVDDLDIYAQVGKNAAYTETFTIPVSDGILDLDFAASADNAKVSAIAIAPVGDLPPQVPTTSGISDLSVVEGEVNSVVDLFAAFDDFEDADADLIYSIENNSDPSLFDDVAINPTTGELTLTYAAIAVVGTSDLTIRATDTDGLFVETSFNVAVTEDNSGGGGNPATLLINAGGSAYTDSLNQQWVADDYFTNGKTFGTSQGISGTTDDPLYQTERYNANLAYEIPVADGEYQVTLEFAELYHNSAGNRVFDVLAEGQLFVDDLDIYAQVGKNAAYTETFTIPVNDGVLDLSFVASADQAKVSAIAIAPVGDLPPQVPTTSGISDVSVVEGEVNSVVDLFAAFDDFEDADVDLVYSIVNNSDPTLFDDAAINPTTGELTLTYAATVVVGSSALTIRATDTDGLFVETSFNVAVTEDNSGGPVNPPTILINAGGNSYTDSLNQQWSADQYSTGGKTFSGSNAIYNTDDPTLYQTERYGGDFAYEIPVANGEYQVSLEFAEIYHNSAGNRVFDVLAEGQLFVDDLDIYAQVGKDAAYTETFMIPVNDGVLDLSFVASADNAKVSAIAIAPVGDLPPQVPTTSGISDLSVVEGEVNSVVDLFAAFDDFEDADVDLVYSIENNSDPTLFDDAAINPTTGELTLTYAATAVVGTSALTIRATDTDGLFVETSFNVAVTEDNSGGGGNPGNPNALLINAGGGAYTDILNQEWVADQDFVNGKTFSTSGDIGGTVDDPLYQTERYDANLAYTIPLVDGEYQVSLEFAELYHNSAGNRVFDVSAEGQLFVDDLDIYAQVGKNAAYSQTFNVSINDGALDLDFVASADAAKVSAIAITPIEPPPGIRVNVGGSEYTDEFGKVWAEDSFNSGTSSIYTTTATISNTTADELFQSGRSGSNFAYAIPVDNVGTYNVNLNFAETIFNAPGQREFTVLVEGQVLRSDLDVWQQSGGAKDQALIEFMTQVPVSDGVLDIQLTASQGEATIAAIEVVEVSPDLLPELFVEMDVPTTLVDYDGDGVVVVNVRGSESQAREFGEVLTEWTWTRDGSTVIERGNNIADADISTTLGLGQHQLSLTIQDSQDPPAVLTGDAIVNIYPVNQVSGTFARYYSGADAPIATLLDSVTALPDLTDVDHVEALPGMAVSESASTLGSSPFNSDVVVAMDGEFTATTTGSYDFVLQGGSDRQFYIDFDLDGDLDQVNPNDIQLTQGQTYSLQSRFAFDNTAPLMAEVLVAIDDATPTTFVPGSLSHDQSSLLPFINNVPTQAQPATVPAFGGTVTLNGFGFFDTTGANPVKVIWDGVELDPADYTLTDGNKIQIQAPPTPGGTVVPVIIETANGQSNTAYVSYSFDNVPIEFTTTAIAGTDSFGPTQATWGPDGRLYVASIAGQIKAYTFDDDYNVTATEEINAIAGLTNANILGIAFDPFADHNDPQLYVAHSQLFVNGGAEIPDGEFSPYTGQVSLLSGANFANLDPVITNLPTSNHDHGVNGLTFDDSGNLLIAQGGNTNAGVKWPQIGDLPESPLAAAILIADVNAPDFNGNIQYEWAGAAPSPDADPTNQVYGDLVTVVPGVDISIYATGLRNAFDLVWTIDGRLYATDNGANSGFGPTPEGQNVNVDDEVNLILPGAYYGHPNPSRSENIYFSTNEPSIPGIYEAPLAIVDASTNGITEYRATTFNGEMRGNILAQDWNETLYSFGVAPDGTFDSTTEFTDLSTALDVITGPGGVIIGVDYSDDNLTVSKPIDAAAVGVTAYDIYPWRSPSAGGAPFVIGGANFSGDVGNTTVTIGGVEVTITSVSGNRIEGVLPSLGSAGLKDIVVNSGGQVSTITNGFRALA